MGLSYRAPSTEILFLFGSENVDGCLRLRSPSSTIPGAQACNKFTKGTDQSYRLRSPETSAEATPRGERRRGCGSAIHQCRRQLSGERSSGQRMWDQLSGLDADLEGPTLQVPRNLHRRTRCTGCSPRSGHGEKPYCSSRFLFLQEGRASKSSGGRPQANSLGAPLCQLKGAPKARAKLFPKLEATRAPKADSSACFA